LIFTERNKEKEGEGEGDKVRERDGVRETERKSK
jgi:hypothetical protein